MDVSNKAFLVLYNSIRVMEESLESRLVEAENVLDSLSERKTVSPEELYSLSEAIETFKDLITQKQVVLSQNLRLQIEQITERLQSEAKHVEQSLTAQFSKSTVDLQESIDDTNVYIREVSSTVTRLDEQVEQKLNGLVENVESRFSTLEASYRSDVRGVSEGLVKKIDQTKQSFQEVVDRFGSAHRMLDVRLSERLASLERAIDELTVDLGSGLEVVTGSIDFLSDDHDKLKNSFSSDIDELKTSVTQSIADVKQGQIDSLDDVRQQIENRITTLASSIKAVADKKWAATQHTHDDLYASVDHSHDFVTPEQLEQSIQRSDQSSRIDQIEQKIPSIDQIKASIDLPKDGENGKDGREWEFQFHPSKRSVLMMKRSDQTDWAQRELVSAKLLADNSGGGIGEGVAAAITRKIIEDEYNGGIGGGGGTIDANLTFIGNVSERIKTFKVIGNTTTNAQGEFTFNFDQTGITEIFSVDVRTFLLTDEGLDPQERIVDCYVTQTVGSTVSGAAFFNRRVGVPVGELQYAKVPADAGLTINLIIEGR